MLSSGYEILYQKGKRYKHRAIFYLNEGRISQDLFTYYSFTYAYTFLLFSLLPFYINFLKTASKYSINRSSTRSLPGFSRNAKTRTRSRRVVWSPRYVDT